MIDGPDIAEVAALMGDPARARMLSALMNGRAWTASELALEAGVGAPTASTHLTKLRYAGLVTDVKQGRHRYFRLGSSDVAQAIEALNILSAAMPPKRLPGPRDQRLRLARSCYGHLAGSSGVQLFRHLTETGHLTGTADGWHLTPNGREWWSKALQIDDAALAQPGRACLDWSERCEHLGGSLGRTLLTAMCASGWLRLGDGRVVEVLKAADRALPDVFNRVAD